MFKKYKAKILFVFLILVHLSFSYYYFGKWWNSSAGTVLILIISFLIWEKNFLSNIGLKLDLRILGKSLLLAGVTIVSSYLFMRYLAQDDQVGIVASNWRNYFHTIFYVLNEEIVLGAILLFPLERELKIKAPAASIGLAIVFSLVHFVFYKWIFLDKGTLGVSTLLSLFFVGIFRNNLILWTKHIAYSWAIHFGWMVVMFGCVHVNLNTDKQLSELTRFNFYLGSIEMLIVSFVLAGLTLFVLIKTK